MDVAADGAVDATSIRTRTAHIRVDPATRAVVTEVPLRAKALKTDLLPCHRGGMDPTNARTLAVRHHDRLPLPLRAAHHRAVVRSSRSCRRPGSARGNEQYLRLTKFFGKLFLINFAIGVVTGIVQEFQFGMNWSDYSRFVGDVFGAPLAIEGLLAFFLESTFLGLWIFGWDRLPKRLHLACIWIVAVGTLLSAYFILAANSWMQHPVGYAQRGDRPRRADRLRRRADQLAAGHLPAHDLRRVPDRRWCCSSRSALWHLRPRRPTTRRPADVPPRRSGSAPG